MPPEARDMAHLWDMLDNARAILQFIDGRQYEEFSSDRMLRSAVERSFTVIGEAARRVSVETREAMPTVPWRSIIGLRNVLAHEYDTIRYERLWAICASELPALIATLEAAGADAISGGETA